MKSLSACYSKALFDVLVYILRPFVLWIGLLMSGFVLGKSQIVSFSIDTTHYYPSESFEIAVVYESSDRGLATGMGIRVHFDSSQISIDSIAKSLRSGQVGIQIKQDSADYDNDSATDYYVNAGWADVNGAWPESVGQPAELLHLKATSAADFSGTQLNLTIASTDVNYVASGDTLLLTSTIGD
jgi:hypothetical protein